MAYWVSIRDGSTGKEKTLVSYASSESAARGEAEKQGLKVDEVFPVSSDTLPSELEKHDRLTPSRRKAFEVFCLSVGQFMSICVCILVIPLSLNTFIIRSTHYLEVQFGGFILTTLVLCTSFAMFSVFSFVKRQIK